MGFEDDLDTLVRLISNVTESFTTALFLVDPQSGYLRLESFYTLGQSIIPETTIPVGQGMIGWVAENRQPLHATHFQHDTTTLQIYGIDEGIKSFLAVPVQFGEIEGVLCIDSKKQYVFTPKTQKILSNFGEHCARLMEKERRRRFQAARMIEVPLLNKFAASLQQVGSRSALVSLLCSLPQELINHKGCALVWADPEHGHWVLAGAAGVLLRTRVELEIAPEQSMCGWVLRHGRPLHLPDLQGNREFPAHLFTPREPQTPVGSFLGIPLAVREEVLGGICFTGDRSHYFSSCDQEVASLIASQAGPVLANILLREQWEGLALRDGLTGAANYRAFEETLNAYVSSANRRQEITVLIIDLDEFRQINERFGYATGDQVLRQVARRLQTFAGPEDVLARLAIDHFALILTRCSIENGLLVGEKVRRLFEESVLPAMHREVHATVSVGVASYPGCGRSALELLRISRQRAMAAKSSGGNTVKGS